LVLNTQYVVQTDWLQTHLNDPDLRILDCTVFLPNYFEPSAAVSARGLIDPITNAFLDLEELRARFERVGATDKQRVISYCGAGIAASSAALALTMLGANNVALYDGSMSEWAADSALPLVTTA
jgi:thiosulfate/3-mercaptopyruvate sulfurtransferase